MRLDDERGKAELNPLLFSDNKLKPEIKEKILEIVDEFLKYAEVSVDIMDVRLVGSNAGYNYSEHSDLDIHIVTDLSKISDPETIARLYFDSVKRNFKDSYDITIKGIEVELYVEDVNSSANSNGIYSVTQDQWVKVPSEDVAPTPEQEAEAKKIESQLAQDIKNASTPEELEKVLNKMYLMRKDSISQYGEAGPGNLAFKSLRNKGILDKIKEVLRDDKSKELSLESKDLKESEEGFTFGSPGTYTLYKVGDISSSNRPTFFAKTYDYARSYSHAGGRRGPQVVKTYEVEIKNPFVVTITDEYPDEATAFIEAYNELFDENYEFEDIVGDDRSTQGKEWMEADQEMLDKAESLGYDCIIYNVKNKYHGNDVSEVSLYASHHSIKELSDGVRESIRRVFNKKEK